MGKNIRNFKQQQNGFNKHKTNNNYFSKTNYIWKNKPIIQR